MGRARTPRTDGFTSFMQRAGEGREEFWLLRWLYGPRGGRGSAAGGDEPPRRRGATPQRPQSDHRLTG